MRIPFIAFLLSLLAVGQISAQLSPDQFKDFEQFAEQVRQDWNVPGFAVAVVKSDSLIYTKGFGLRDREKDLPVTPHTLFAIGSSSKAFTAMSVLQQVEEGRLELDAPVIRYLPNFRMWDDYVTMHLTVRDLLCHRSGLPRHDVAWYGSQASREELIRRLRYLEPNAGFRESFQYQNLMFMTAGYLAGQVAGSDWETQVRQHIFKPLDMKRSNFQVKKMAADDNAALPYHEPEDSQVVRMDYRNITVVGPAGSINSSAEEMSRWLMALLNGGKYEDRKMADAASVQQALSSNMVVLAAWRQALMVDNEGAPLTYGLGWFLSHHKGHRMATHGGNIDGFSAEVAMLPDDSLGVVILSNKNGSPLPGILRNYLFDLALGEQPTDWNGKLKTMVEQRKAAQQEEAEDIVRQEGTQPSHPLKHYAGTYAYPGYDPITVTFENDSLFLQFAASKELLPLQHYHYDVFYNEHPVFKEIKVQFKTDLEGSVASLAMKVEPALDPVTFERQPESKKFTEEELQAFAGAYLIMGVQRISVSVEEGQLKMAVPGQPTYTLQHREGLKFDLEGLDGYTAVFQQNDTGEVTKLTMIQPNGQFQGEKVKE